MGKIFDMVCLLVGLVLMAVIAVHAWPVFVAFIVWLLIGLHKRQKKEERWENEP